jgi:protein-S-isoprenylcysteine O-methyltransferase Ste14
VPATTLCLLISVFAQAIVILYPGVFIFWFVFHSRIERWRGIGKRAYLYACLGWPVTGVVLLLWRHWIFHLRWPTPWWMIAIGLAALTAAFRVGILAARAISRQTLVGLVELEPQRNPQKLLQTGIYSKTRNPVYFTHWLVILAAAALSGYAANWIFWAIDSLLLMILIRVEERELLARYGSQFQAYMRGVPRFVPRRPW